MALVLSVMFILGIVAVKFAVFVNVDKVPLAGKYNCPEIVRILVDAVSIVIEFTYKLATDKVPALSVRSPHVKSVTPVIVSDCPLLIVIPVAPVVVVKFPFIVEPAVAVAKVTVPPTNVFPFIVKVEPPVPVNVIDGDAEIMAWLVASVRFPTIFRVCPPAFSQSAVVPDWNVKDLIVPFKNDTLPPVLVTYTSVLAFVPGSSVIVPAPVPAIYTNGEVSTELSVNDFVALVLSVMFILGIVAVKPVVVVVAKVPLPVKYRAFPAAISSLRVVPLLEVIELIYTLSPADKVPDISVRVPHTISPGQFTACPLLIVSPPVEVKGPVIVDALDAPVNVTNPVKVFNGSDAGIVSVEPALPVNVMDGDDVIVP